MADEIDDGSEVEAAGTCEVYNAEDSFTSFVQIMLAVLALGSLYIKRQQEVPRRKFETWFLDVSKQGIGAVFAHVLNMIIAKIIAQNVRGDRQLDDECAWYAINYLIDTTLGLVLSIMGLKLVEYLAKLLNCSMLDNRGVYTGPTRYLTWFVQLIVWLVVLTLVKVIICWFMWLTSESLAWFGEVLFEPFQSNIRFELLFVMIFFPGLLNVIYFWIIDSYLKAAKHHHHAHEPHDDYVVTSPDDLDQIDASKKESMLTEDEKKYVHVNYSDIARDSSQKYEQPQVPEIKQNNTEKPDVTLV